MNKYFDQVKADIKDRLECMLYDSPVKPSTRNYDNLTHWTYNILITMSKPSPRTQAYESTINGLVNAFVEGWR